MKKSTVPVDYAASGVDITAGNAAVEKIKGFAASTFSPAVLSGLGSFASFFDLGPVLASYRHPVLVQSTDGVGTKIMIAQMARDFSTIGMDLVSACANDIVVHGAQPLTFLDYIANDRLEPDVVASMVEGMAKACREAGISLVGGETAEMPGTYLPGEHDLVGLVTGIVERDKIIDGSTVQSGDVLLGVASTGLHTNGYSLARKVLFEVGSMQLSDALPEDDQGRTIGQALLAPHASYAKPVATLLAQGCPIKSMAHITGGGLLENVPRVMPQTVDAVFDPSSWPLQPLFKLIREVGMVSGHEMYRTLNMGIGLVVMVGAEHASDVLAAMGDAFEQPVFEIGTVTAGSGKSIITGLGR